jgi:hypothetical protein
MFSLSSIYFHQGPHSKFICVADLSPQILIQIKVEIAITVKKQRYENYHNFLLEQNLLIYHSKFKDENSKIR